MCREGYSVLRVISPFGPLWINGVVVPGSNTARDARWRKANKSQKATSERVAAYSQSLDLATSAIRAAIQNEASEAITGLHDINTAVGVLLRNAEAIVAGLEGKDDYERIENAAPALKSLLKSVNLLESRLKLAFLIANPESAKYGQRRNTPVYRLFHLMLRLFEQEAQRRGVTLRMTGTSYNTLLLYDSFATIPLVLIDNAIKYSPKKREIMVHVEDSGRTCRARVESWGEIVPHQYRNKIFERGVRAPGAKKNAAAGAGLGLYIAKIVADANACSLSYWATTKRHDDTEGTNVFALDIKDAPET